MHVSVWAYMSVCVDTGSVQDAGDIFLLVFSYCQGPGSLTKPKSHCLDYWLASELLGSACVCTSMLG